MSIAQKGSRRIVVDGVTYRWSVRSRPTYGQALAESSMTVAIVNDESSGSTLVATLDVARPDNWMHQRSAPVTPVIVERAIRTALAEGWRSDENGSAFAVAVVSSR
jgi:hypothetical protein